MKTILTASVLLAPLIALAAPAANSSPGSITREPAASYAERRDDRRTPPTPTANPFRRDDRRDSDRPDPRPDHDNCYDRDRDRRDDDHRPAPHIARRDLDRTINALYREVLLRDADADGLRHYRDRIVRENWTEARLRSALRESAEFRGTVVNTIITRAYRDILGRAPDASGLETYRHKIIARGLTDEGLRRILIDSAEYRDRLVLVAANTSTRPTSVGGGPRDSDRRMR